MALTASWKGQTKVKRREAEIFVRMHTSIDLGVVECCVAEQEVTVMN